MNIKIKDFLRLFHTDVDFCVSLCDSVEVTCCSFYRCLELFGDMDLWFARPVGDGVIALYVEDKKYESNK